MEKLYSVSKNKTGSWLWLRLWLLIVKLRLKLKKVGKTTRPFRYDLNQIPYDYKVEVRNRFKGLNLIDRVPVGWRFMTLYRKQGSRPSPWKRNAKKQDDLSSVIPFSSCLKSFPASGSFPICQFFASGDQSIGASTSTSILPMSIQDLFPLRLTGWISLLSKGLSRVFFNTTIQKHQFFGTQLSLWSNSHIHTWLLENS